MSKIGIIGDAKVPVGMKVEITVKEDIDGDGEIENENTVSLKDGKYVYELEGFQGDLDNEFKHTINMGRDPNGPALDPTRDDPKGPAISGLSTIIAGPARSNNLDPKAAAYKFREADYFLAQMDRGDPKFYRFHINGFLSAVYSIDEIVTTDWAEWADSTGKVELHRMIMKNRNQSTHLGKPAKGSLRPPLGASREYDFGEDQLVKQAFYFVGVPVSVIEEFVPAEDRIPLADDSADMEESPYARTVPATQVCGLYISLLQDRLRDWIEGLNNEDFPYDLNELT